jgi:hypothetical protein
MLKRLLNSRVVYQSFQEVGGFLALELRQLQSF